MNGKDLELLEGYLHDGLSYAERSRLEERLNSEPELRVLLDDVRAASALTDQLRASRETGLSDTNPSVEGYDVEREIHRGGQGIVYAATQRSTGRRVALKVLLAGRASTRRQDQRLEREIELASSISHPGVVTVFDRAQTDDQSPVLVMELIDGRPLDTYIRDAAPGPRRVLELMAEICDIVSAAHQRGVIHRDLKPSNILIDADGAPHVLDFGLAKALEPGQARSLVTHEGEFMGTLAYAGPEQVERGAVAADVRSDVYALGAITGEALTGSLPIDVSGPIASAIGRIRETPPTPPSVRRHGLDKDVDTIVLTAMAKEPQRRYQSAAALAADIRRVIRDEPILARPASTLYQLRKFAKRNKVLVVSTTVAVLALVTVTTVVSVALVRTSAANARTLSAKADAEIDADKQSRMNEFLRRMLTSVEPGNSGPDLRVVDLLEECEGRIETEFADYPELRARLHATLGQTYWRLGVLDQAERHQSLAVDLFEQLDERADPGDLPAALSELGSIELSRGNIERAVLLHERARKLWLHPAANDDPRRWRTHVNLAAAFSTQGMIKQAEQLYIQSLEALTGSDVDSRILRAQALTSLGALYRPLERYQEARDAYDEALPILRELRGDEHPDTLACLGNQAEVLVSLGEFDGAETRMRELIDIRRRVFGPEHERVGIAVNNLADFLRTQERTDEAIAQFRVAHEIFSQSLGERHPRVGMVSLNLGVTLLRSGQPSAALPRLDHAAQILEGAVPPGHWILAQARLSLGEAYLRLDRPEEAEPLLRISQQQLVAHFGAEHWRSLAASDLVQELDTVLAGIPASP